MPDFRSIILAELATRKMNMHSLAVASGVNDRAVHDFLTGKSKSIRSDSLAKLLDALQIEARSTLRRRPKTA